MQQMQGLTSRACATWARWELDYAFIQTRQKAFGEIKMAQFCKRACNLSTRYLAIVIWISHNSGAIWNTRKKNKRLENNQKCQKPTHDNSQLRTRTSLHVTGAHSRSWAGHKPAHQRNVCFHVLDNKILPCERSICRLNEHKQEIEYLHTCNYQLDLVKQRSHLGCREYRDKGQQPIHENRTMHAFDSVEREWISLTCLDNLLHLQDSWQLSKLRNCNPGGFWKLVFRLDIVECLKGIDHLGIPEIHSC